MLIQFSDPIRRDIEATIRLSTEHSRILNVYALAGEIQIRHPDANIALEDIAALVAQLGAQSGCALELDAREGVPAYSA